MDPEEPENIHRDCLFDGNLERTEPATMSKGPGSRLLTDRPSVARSMPQRRLTRRTTGRGMVSRMIQRWIMKKARAGLFFKSAFSLPDKVSDSACRKRLDDVAQRGD